MFLFLFIAQTLATLCTIDDKIESYIFTQISPMSNQWNYDNLGPGIIRTCTGSTEAKRPIKASAEGLSGLKLNFEYMDFDLVTVDRAETYPFAKYVTKNMKLYVQTETNVQVLYTSKYFQYSLPEHNLDIWSALPTAEIQIYFEQDELFSTCDSEPKYAILSIPVLSVNNYFYGPVMNSVDTTLKDFNFFMNVTSTIKSDSVSYVSYIGPLNIPPCSDTHWFVLTQPMLMDYTNLQALLDRNPSKSIKQRDLTTKSLSLSKGVFYYYRDDILLNYDDSLQWISTWVAAIAPCLFFALVGCIYGVWKLSNIGRYKRPEEKEEEAVQIVDHMEDEKLHA